MRKLQNKISKQSEVSKSATSINEVNANVLFLNGSFVVAHYCIMTGFDNYSHSFYTRKVKVLSLPETIKEKSTFRAKALRRELVTRRFFLYRFR